MTFNPPPKKTCEVRFTWQHAFGPFRSEWVQMPGRHRAGGRVCWLPFQGYRYLMLQYLFTKYTRNALEVTQVVGFDDESSSVKETQQMLHRRELRGLFALMRITTALLPIPFIDEDMPSISSVPSRFFFVSIPPTLRSLFSLHISLELLKPTVPTVVTSFKRTRRKP